MSHEFTERGQAENVHGEVVKATPGAIDPSEKDWPEVLDRSVNRVADVIQERQQLQHELSKATISIDKGLLLVIGLALLATLLFTFYMLARDKLQAVTQVLYPILTALLGFMSGYFAGSGRKGARQK
ncbi:MAG: hypothetical protein WCC06_08070 [Candidatus Aminicenantales bacterium]